jgi:hypothetical protein
MAVHQVVDVTSVWDTFVTAVRAMHVAGVMSPTIVLRRTAFRVLTARADLVLVDMIPMYVVHVPIVKVIGVAVVQHGRVAAILTMGVGVAFVLAAAFCHNPPVVIMRRKPRAGQTLDGWIGWIRYRLGESSSSFAH